MDGGEDLLGVPEVDRILAAAVPREAVPGMVPLRKKAPVVEFVSVGSGAGKTHLLYCVAASCTLPVGRGGKGAAVVVFDNDGRFDALRLARIMKSRIRSCGVEVTEVEVEDIARDALRHVHIYRPQSSGSMIEMLEAVPEYLMEFGSHYSADRSLRAILVDSMSAFYWQDRMAESIPGGEELGFQETYQAIVHHLKKASAAFGAFIVVTNWGLHLKDRNRGTSGSPGAISAGAGPEPTPSGGNEHVQMFRSHLPQPWTKFVDVNFVVERDVIAPFSRGASVVEALSRNEAREKQVNKNGFTGWVSFQDLEPDAQNALKGKDGMFHYSITPDEITFSSGP